ncbi:MAG: WbqC family protein [Saprospiraceae bacterium]
MKLIIENQILAPIYVFSEFLRSDLVIIEKFDTFQKRTFRNRFFILSDKGPQMISIPLQKGKNHLLFEEVLISYDMDWVKVLINTLKTNYGSSPFFEHYFDSLCDIFNAKFEYLFDLNNALRDFLLSSLDIELKIEYSDSYINNYSDVEDLRDYILPSNFNEDKFLSNVTYNQVFEFKGGFVPNLSVIDLLFNRGKYGFQILSDYPSK